MESDQRYTEQNRRGTAIQAVDLVTRFLGREGTENKSLQGSVIRRKELTERPGQGPEYKYICRKDTHVPRYRSPLGQGFEDDVHRRKGIFAQTRLLTKCFIRPRENRLTTSSSTSFRNLLKVPLSKFRAFL
jgi:hypothetical protein